MLISHVLVRSESIYIPDPELLRIVACKQGLISNLLKLTCYEKSCLWPKEGKKRKEACPTENELKR